MGPGFGARLCCRGSCPCPGLLLGSRGSTAVLPRKARKVELQPFKPAVALFFLFRSHAFLAVQGRVSTGRWHHMIVVPTCNGSAPVKSVAEYLLSMQKSVNVTERVAMI